MHESLEHRKDTPVSASRRTLLLGQRLSVLHLARMLPLVEPGVVIVGACLDESPPPGQLLVHTLAQSQGDTQTRQAVEVFGGFDALVNCVREGCIDRALITLPVEKSQTIEILTQLLDTLEVTWRLMPTLADQLAGKCDHLAITRVTDEAVIDTDSASQGSDTCFAGDRSENEAMMLAANAGVEVGRSHAGDVSFKGTLVDPCALDPEQLLGRQRAQLYEDSIEQIIVGQTVLITGAGGSIGSEIARQVARYRPRLVVLVERSENSLFEIDREMVRLHPEVERRAVLHDVTNASKTLVMMSEYRPDVVFHAAAHKHVPMMEEHPAAAVENNLYGTRSMADASSEVGVSRFVMISSDKAVNPSSVMGATKRLAELYIQYLNARSSTMFSMVRFGNVLGSACSVLPIWAKQLATGDAITVTHPDMLRYFMTIPEAAGLVLQSAALTGGEQIDGAEGSAEVFLLDMGEPIGIVDLASRFIQCQGLIPGRDVQITFTGIRPGEKLFEELAYESEAMLPTRHQSIRIWQTKPPTGQRMEQVIQSFDQLREAGDPNGHHWQAASSAKIMKTIRASVPEMRGGDKGMSSHTTKAKAG